MMNEAARTSGILQAVEPKKTEMFKRQSRSKEANENCLQVSVHPEDNCHTAGTYN